MPELDFRAPACSSTPPLRAGETVALERNQSNYLGNVLRLAAGETILVFNGRDGEWQAADRRAASGPTVSSIVAQTRPQDRLPDIAYVFAPLKHARLDYMVQKAVEMGASTLQPVLTRHHPGLAGQRRADARQCHRGRRAMRHPQPRRGRRAGAARSLSRPARGQAPAGVLRRGGGHRAIPCEALQQGLTAADGIDVLIGPEGGFAEEERALLLRQPKTLRLSLGPRILRADTAGVAALALVQAALGDWAGPG